MNRGASGRTGRSGPNGTRKTPRSARGEYYVENSASAAEGICAICEAPFPRIPGPGRPREYCSRACSEVAYAVGRLRQVVDDIRRPGPVRSYIVSEVLNRLPVDREALSQRARRQRRDFDGRFLSSRRR